MSSEKRILKINEDLFKIPEKTRKKRDENDGSSIPKIKVKNTLASNKQKTLRKGMLKMIRAKQEEEYRKLFDNTSRKTGGTTSDTSSNNEEFKKDFEESFDYLSSLVEKVKDIPNTNTCNQTLKNYESIATTPAQFVQHHEKPLYGCLKNGTLPTYRNYYNKNQTQKANPQPTVPAPSSVQNLVPTYQAPIPSTFAGPMMQMPTQIPTPSQPTYSIPTIKVPPSQLLQPRQSSIPDIREKSVLHERIKNDKIGGNNTNKHKLRYKKQKKIFRRTYNVGRTKFSNKVGVLVSNKTIRSKIMTKSQNLKMTPMPEVRKQLIKRGLIKVGSIAPDDVLRKMYESIEMICGEIQNHNADNLLHNFLNDGDAKI